MGPRADYACLSRKCQQDGAATVYELPVNSVCCPACGSKRIQRIWTPPHISHGVAAHVDRVTEPEWQRMHGQKESVRSHEANQRAIEDRVRHEVPMLSLAERDRLAEQNNRIHAVPMRHMASQLGRDPSGKAVAPGLQAGNPIPSPSAPAHEVQPIAPRLRDLTSVVGRAKVEP